MTPRNKPPLLSEARLREIMRGILGWAAFEAVVAVFLIGLFAVFH